MKEPWNKRLRYCFFYPALGKFPRWLAYEIAHRVPGALGLADRSRLSAMRQNLVKVLGEDCNPASLIRAHYAMRSLEDLDPYFMTGIPSKYSWYDFMEFRNIEIFEQAYARGRGVILLTGHYGRFCMAFIALGNQGYRVGGVTVEIEDNPFWGPCEKEHFRFKTTGLEHHAGGHAAKVGNVAQLKALFSLLKGQGAAVVLVDVFDGREDNHSLSFLGGRAKFPAGILRVAHHNRSPVVGFFAHQEGKKVVIEFEQGADPESPEDYEALAQYVKILERRILARPQEWWFWPDLQNIWSQG